MTLDTGDPNAVRQAARNILAQSQYQSQQQTVWDRIVYYVTHPLALLDLAFNWIVDRFLGSGSGRYVAWAITAVALAVVVFLFVRLQRSTSQAGAVRIHYAPALTGKSVDELLAEAEALEAREQWRDAIRVRYSALILSLANRGVVRARAGRTTGEYAREVALGAPAVIAAFRQATALFEWVWYGTGNPSREDALEFRMLATGVDKQVAA